tara:strand:+ start:6227 stop:6457 length:231 start_codon:yes stop_codon:yes gene_type:complete
MGLDVLNLSDLDEVLQRDTDGKITWLVSKVSDLDNRVETIETNHLVHIEGEIKSLAQKVSIILMVGFSIITGINIM